MDDTFSKPLINIYILYRTLLNNFILQLRNHSIGCVQVARDFTIVSVHFGLDLGRCHPFLTIPRKKHYYDQEYYPQKHILIPKIICFITMNLENYVLENFPNEVFAITKIISRNGYTRSLSILRVCLDTEGINIWFILKKRCGYTMYTR